MLVRRAVSLLSLLAILLATILALPGAANATVHPSSFSELSTPGYTNSGDQRVVLSGRVAPAAAGRAVSLYDGDTWIAGTHTDAAGRFSFNVGVDVTTTFHFFSKRQSVGNDVYERVKSGRFAVRSLRLWDSFDYSSWAQMDARWDVRQQGAFLKGRSHQRASAAAVGFADGKLLMRVKRDRKHGTRTKPKFLVPHVTAGDLGGMVRGHLEARIKFHRPRGAHGALWWQAGYCPGGAEIDAVEFFGERAPGTAAVERQKVQHTIHPASADCSAGTQIAHHTWASGKRANTWWSSFHTYEVFWNTDGYRFFVDGKKVAQVTSLPGATAPAEVILSLLVNDGKEYRAIKRHYLAGRSLAAYTMKVDWIRVWR